MEDALQSILAVIPIAASLFALPMQGAPPEQATQPVQGAQSEAEGDPNERICRAAPSPTGSRLGSTRRCGTRAQWRDWNLSRTYDRRAIESLQTQRSCRENDCR